MVSMENRWSEEQIRHALEGLEGWRYDDGRIERVFEFATYADGVAFATRIFLLSEKQGHHPDAVCVLWKKVGVAYTTHDVGGVTERDLKAATMINLLYQRFAD